MRLRLGIVQVVVLASVAALANAGGAGASAATAELISIPGAGGAVSPAQSEGPALSGDGRFVAYTSSALDALGRIGRAVFVRDRLSGLTERVDVSNGGTVANYNSQDASISADGRFVVFRSEASNLVFGDTNNRDDIFVRDRVGGTTERVSIGTSGAQAPTGACCDAAISATGRYVAFASGGRLVSGTPAAPSDIYLRDRETGRTRLISNGIGGRANSWSYGPSISADGRYVAFVSDATNLVAADTNGYSDVFVYDRADGTTRLVSAAADGIQANERSSMATISADGRVVAFASEASNLVAGDTNLARDAFVRDLVTGSFERVSDSTLGKGIRGISLNADGRYVVYSDSTIFLRDRSTGGRTQLTSGLEDDNPVISADGTVVAFDTNLTLAPEDYANNRDVYVKTRPDNIPPALVLPGTITVSATSTAGSPVSYTVSARDDVDPSPRVSCSPASGSTFPIGATTVTCTATDAAGNTATDSFTVRVVGFPVASSCKASWTPMAGSSFLASDVAASPTDAWAVGIKNSVVGHWDGASWTTAPSAVYQPRAVAAASAGDAWIVGRNGSAHWDGTSWSTIPVAAVPGGEVFLEDVQIFASNDVWAVGSSWVGSTQRPVIEHWDGSAWSIVPAAPGGADQLNGVSGVSPTDIWAVGNPGKIEHWDGSRWTTVPSPAPAVSSWQLWGIEARAADDVWAVGQQWSEGGWRPVIEHWDGKAWSIVPSPSMEATLAGVSAVSADDVWAAGQTPAPGASSPGLVLLHWDGASWTTVDTGTASAGYARGSVEALPNGVVLAAGTQIQELCEINVSDGGFAPAASRGMVMGKPIFWNVSAGTHTVTDGSGLGLFDSGAIAAGGSFTTSFAAAGSYSILDSATRRTSLVTVGLKAIPTTAPVGTVSLTWASQEAAAGFVYDVQVLRPGSSAFADLAAGATAAGTSFSADAGAGTYSFRAHVRRLDGGAISGWSPTKSVTLQP